MSSYKRSGQPLRLNANEMTKAIRAGEMLDQLMGRQGGTSGSMPRSLMARVKNAGSADIPAWGLCRWFGDPVQPATIGGTVPELVLRTVTDTTRPIGVAVNQIKAAASPNPAEIGQVQIMGVCWARCRGPISANDPLMPDSSFRGVKDTVGGSNVKALAGVAGSTDAIIPVLIGGGGGCSKKYQLFVFGNPLSGSFVIPVRAQYKDPGTGERSGTYFTENITIPYNATVTQTKNAIEGHTYIDVDEVTVTGSLTLLSSPHSITLPAGVDFGTGTATIDSAGLVRRGIEIPRAYLSECCT